MSHPVFLSYARSASRPYARAVYEALGGEAAGIAFLDEEDIELGERFPERIVGALLSARVIVVFAEPVYFTRWYCLLELRVARTPFLKSLEKPGGFPGERDAMLAPLVLALPPSGTPPELDRFPALVQGTNWPGVGDAEAIAALVHSRLGQTTHTVGQLLEQAGATALRDEILEATRLPPPLPLVSVPRAPQGIAPSIRDAFVGRADDLWRIDDLLSTRDGGPTATAALAGSIEGGGGVGKTRLALEYLHRFGPKRFPGGLFWIDAEADPASLEVRHHTILQALDPHAPPLTTYTGSHPTSLRDDLLRAVQALPRAAPALFVVDNVPEPESGKAPEPLARWCPVVGFAPVLATSRSHLSVGEIGTVSPIRVEPLAEEAAVALLMREVPDRNQLSRKEWVEIAEWVGRLPLALELLNAVLRAGGTSSSELQALSHASSVAGALDKAMEAIRPSVPAGALRGVSEALSISYERLSEQEREAARLLAWLAPEPIPLEILSALGDPPFTPATRASLAFRSIITRDESAGVPVYGSMHRVLADFLRTRSPARQDEIARVLTALLDVLTPGRCRNPRDWGLVNLTRPHAQGALDRSVPADGNISLAEMWVDLAITTGLSFLYQGFSKDAEYVYRNALHVSRREWGAENRRTLISMGNLASSLNALGNFTEARELQETVLEVERRVLGEEHPETLNSMNNLASIIGKQGDFVEARTLRENVLESSKRILGEEHPRTLTSMNNLAVTLSDVGDYTGARELQETVVEVRRRMLGEEHPDTLTSMNNLAYTLRNQGDFAGARTLRERVVEGSRRILGEEHPHTLISMNNLATVLSDQGDYAGARQLQETVLETERRILGEEHPDTLNSMNNLADILNTQGDFARARVLQEVVLEGRRRILGEEHPHTLTSMNNLANTLSGEGDLAGARELQESVLEARRRTQGNDHPNTLTSMNNLAGTLVNQGDFTGARALWENVIEGSRRILGEEHPHTLSSMNNLGITLWLQGDIPAARALAATVLSLRRRTLGEEHPRTLESVRLLAEIRTAEERVRPRSRKEQVLDALRRLWSWGVAPPEGP